MDATRALETIASLQAVAGARVSPGRNGNGTVIDFPCTCGGRATYADPAHTVACDRCGSRGGPNMALKMAGLKGRPVPPAPEVRVRKATAPERKPAPAAPVGDNGALLAAMAANTAAVLELARSIGALAAALVPAPVVTAVEPTRKPRKAAAA